MYNDIVSLAIRRMGYFVMINEQGPGWVDGRPMREQKGWTEHADFMNALEAEGLVVLGGPLKYARHRALLVLNSPDEQVLRKRLAEDPWMRSGVLRNLEFYPWELLLGKLQ